MNVKIGRARSGVRTHAETPPVDLNPVALLIYLLHSASLCSHPTSPSPCASRRTSGNRLFHYPASSALILSKGNRPKALLGSVAHCPPCPTTHPSDDDGWVAQISKVLVGAHSCASDKTGSQENVEDIAEHSPATHTCLACVPINRIHLCTATVDGTAATLPCCRDVPATCTLLPSIRKSSNAPRDAPAHRHGTQQLHWPPQASVDAKAGARTQHRIDGKECGGDGVALEKRRLGARAWPGFEPGTTRTLSEYHTPRPPGRRPTDLHIITMLVCLPIYQQTTPLFSRSTAQHNTIHRNPLPPFTSTASRSPLPIRSYPRSVMPRLCTPSLPSTHPLFLPSFLPSAASFPKECIRMPTPSPPSTHSLMPDTQPIHPPTHPFIHASIHLSPSIATYLPTH
ncbi:hypothetical protein TSMEX_007333 [Taenia solium]|eukprot:TsM_000953100 transcript=TsM_000953100 gene=TsM_000953100